MKHSIKAVDGPLDNVAVGGPKRSGESIKRYPLSEPTSLKTVALANLHLRLRSKLWLELPQRNPNQYLKRLCIHECIHATVEPAKNAQ